MQSVKWQVPHFCCASVHPGRSEGQDRHSRWQRDLLGRQARCHGCEYQTHEDGRHGVAIHRSSSDDVGRSALNHIAPIASRIPVGNRRLRLTVAAGGAPKSSMALQAPRCQFRNALRAVFRNYAEDETAISLSLMQVNHANGLWLDL